MYIKRNYTIHALFQKQQLGKKTEFCTKAGGVPNTEVRLCPFTKL